MAGFADDLKGPLVQQDSADVGRRRTHDHRNGPTITDDGANGVLVFDYSSMARTVQLATITITAEQLTASSGLQDFTIATLPAGSMIVGVAGALGQTFAIAGSTFVHAAIGTAVDPDAIVRQAHLHASAVDGQVSSMGSGIAPSRFFASATALTLQISSDQPLNTASAGSVTFRVAYAVVG